MVVSNDPIFQFWYLIWPHFVCKISLKRSSLSICINNILLFCFQMHARDCVWRIMRIELYRKSMLMAMLQDSFEQWIICTPDQMNRIFIKVLGITWILVLGHTLLGKLRHYQVAAHFMDL